MSGEIPLHKVVLPGSPQSVLMNGGYYYNDFLPRDWHNPQKFYTELLVYRHKESYEPGPIPGSLW